MSREDILYILVTIPLTFHIRSNLKNQSGDGDLPDSVSHLESKECAVFKQLFFIKSIFVLRSWSKFYIILFCLVFSWFFKFFFWFCTGPVLPRVRCLSVRVSKGCIFRTEISRYLIFLQSAYGRYKKNKIKKHLEKQSNPLLHL